MNEHRSPDFPGVGTVMEAIPGFEKPSSWTGLLAPGGMAPALARRIAAIRPEQHVDIGSSVLTMGVLCAQVPTVFVDYRPLRASIPGLSCVAGDANHLPFADGSIAFATLDSIVGVYDPKDRLSWERGQQAGRFYGAPEALRVSENGMSVAFAYDANNVSSSTLYFDVGERRLGASAPRNALFCFEMSSRRVR